MCEIREVFVAVVAYAMNMQEMSKKGVVWRDLELHETGAGKSKTASHSDTNERTSQDGDAESGRSAHQWRLKLGSNR
jgi:hypothetical protein